MKYSIVWGIHLVVEFSNGNVAYEPKKGLIQILQFEIMREVIYWVLKSVCMKEDMGDSHYVLLDGHSLGMETKAQPKILQPCKHIKKYEGEREGSIKKFLELGFSKIHMIPFASIVPWENKRDE